MTLPAWGASEGVPPSATAPSTLWAEPAAYRPRAPELRVVMLDIGQGDGIFLQTPGGKIALIDGGGTPSWSDFDYEPGKEKVVPFLKENGVTKIDYVLISHPHGDHIGGLLEVFRQFPVGQLIDPGVEHDEPEYPELLKLAKQRNSDYLVAGEGDRLDWDPALRIEVLGPPRDFSYDDLNNNSLVVKVTHGRVTFLFMGDAEEEAERRIARRYKTALKAQVLKVGHHGSKTSTSARFIELVDPETALVSCGRRNLFGHPHAQTLSRLKSRGMRVFRTDADGDIAVRSDGFHYTAEREVDSLRSQYEKK